MRPLFPAFVLTALAIAAGHGAATIDIDCDRLRSLPDAPAIRERLESLMPEDGRKRLDVLHQLFQFDPRRDLHRVVVSIPAPGQAPTIRLVGLPAQRIAAALALHGGGVTVCGGCTGYPLPKRPQALFVALSATEALIGRGDLLKKSTAAPAALPPVAAQAITAHVVPGDHPRARWMEQVATLDLATDGAGHLTIKAQADDEAAAAELERRLGVVRDMVDVGARGRLPAMQDLQQVLTASAVARTGKELAITATVPAELRARLIDHLLDRLEARRKS